MRSRTLSLREPDKAAALRRRVQTDVRLLSGLPPFLATMAAFTLVFPANSSEQHFLYASLIDKHLRDDLEEWKVINWHSRFCRLVPLGTKGDGNCLLHALSLALWGVHDHQATLRGLLSRALMEPSPSRDQVAHRFRLERAAELLQETEDDFQLDSTEWAEEWQCVVENAHIPQHHQGEPINYPYLESAHVFVLANILRRPIIVHSSNHVLGLDGSRVARNHMQGVYLPLLWRPQDCEQTPLLLAHHGSHFTALVPCEPGEGEGRLMAVALVRADSEPLPLHFLLKEESTQAESLLRSYLNLFHEPCLAAKLTFKAMPTEMDVLLDYGSRAEDRGTYGSVPSVPIEPQMLDNGRNDPRNSNKASSYPGHPDVWRQYREPNPTTAHYAHVTSHASPENRMSRSMTDVPEMGDAVLLSVTDHACEVGSCRYLASQNTFPYCHEHKHLRQPAALAQTSMQEPPAAAEQYSMTQEECQQPHCRFLASRNTYPYCHEHKLLRPRQPVLELQQCAVRACPLRASVDTLPYCHMHAGRANPVDTQSYTFGPSREPATVDTERQLSVMEELCAVQGCRYFASRNTYPLCHEHHQLNQSPAPAASPALTPPYYSSLTPDKCTVSGCGFMASQHSRPYCHEHTEVLTSGSTVELSLTGEPCEFPGCRYYSSRHTAPYCHVHGSRIRAAPRQRSIMDRQCASPQCQFYASGDTYPYCRTHYSFSLLEPEVRTGPQRRRLSEERHSWSGASSHVPPERPLVSCRDDLEVPLCVIQGCMFPAAPAYSGLCYAHKQHQSEPAPSRHIYRPAPPTGCENHLVNKPCQNPNCSGIGLNVNNGLCWECFGRQSLMQSRQPVRTAVRYSSTLPRSSSWRAMPARDMMIRTSEFQRTMQEAENRSRATAMQCRGNNCRNYGNATNRGLCNSCAPRR